DRVRRHVRASTRTAPGSYGTSAPLVAVCGQPAAGIRIARIVVTSAPTAAMYRLGARLAGPAVGVAAAVIFAALSLNPKLLGLAAYAEHFALLPVVAGALLLWRVAPPRPPGPLLGFGSRFRLGPLRRPSA